MHLSHSLSLRWTLSTALPGGFLHNRKMARFFRQVQPFPRLPSLSRLIRISSLSTVLILKDRVSPVLLLWPQASPKAYQHCGFHRCWPTSRHMQSSWGENCSPLRAGPRLFLGLSLHWGLSLSELSVGCHV